jgi:fatty acid desaturase
MAEPAKKAPSEDPPVSDPSAVARAYRLHRAKRRVRQERTRARRRANVRFWIVLLGLLALSVYISVVIWHQVQKLFGL